MTGTVDDEALLERLSALGAGGWDHLNGTLEAHLHGVRALLREWGARPVLQRAGLFHAVYGTAGFDAAMVDVEGRLAVADVIGKEAERIVYTYCACARDHVWPRIGQGVDIIVFRDRFTGDERVLDGSEAREFCELTIANEVEIARGSASFVEQHGSGLSDLSLRMRPWLSDGASSASSIFAFDRAGSAGSPTGGGFASSRAHPEHGRTP